MFCFIPTVDLIHITNYAYHFIFTITSFEILHTKKKYCVIRAPKAWHNLKKKLFSISGWLRNAYLFKYNERSHWNQNILKLSFTSFCLLHFLPHNKPRNKQSHSFFLCKNIYIFLIIYQMCFSLFFEFTVNNSIHHMGFLF